MSTEAPILEPDVERPHTVAEPIVGWQRVLLIFTGCVLVSLLITAACLPPSANGMGTHQQLGLPPCSMVMFFDMRCPACGMTTSWAHLMRGQIVQSAHANTGGLMLALFALVGGRRPLVARHARPRLGAGLRQPDFRRDNRPMGVAGFLVNAMTGNRTWRCEINVRGGAVATVCQQTSVQTGERAAHLRLIFSGTLHNRPYALCRALAKLTDPP
jgi:hypothetical protein